MESVHLVLGRPLGLFQPLDCSHIPFVQGGRMACGGDVRTAHSFPLLESRVMPRWFEHTSLFPLFFQKEIMIPLRHSSGIVFLIHTMLIV